MSDIIFSGFLSFCEEHLQDTDAYDLKKLMIKRYNECNHDYKVSNDFKDLVFITQAKIDSDSSRIFVHLRDFLGELKAYRNKKGSKKKGGKRVRDSGVSDSETPSPKSFKGENSESSSDAKSNHKKASYNKSGTDSDVDSGVESKSKTVKNNATNFTGVNGVCKKSDKVTVFEVASKADDVDDCVVIDDDDDSHCVKEDEKVTNEVQSVSKQSDEIQSVGKKKTSAFQDAFQSFTNRNSKVLEISDNCKSNSESEENEDSKESQSSSDVKKIQIDSNSRSDLREPSTPVCKDKKDLETQTPSEKHEKMDISFNKSVKNDDEKCTENEAISVSDDLDSDVMSIESPKPSTSSDYKGKSPEPSTSHDHVTCTGSHMFLVKSNTAGEEKSDDSSENEEKEKGQEVEENQEEDGQQKELEGQQEEEKGVERPQEDVDGEMEKNDKGKSIENEKSETKDGENENEEDVPDTPEKSAKVKKASKRQIRRLEQLLEDIRDQIEKLKEKELSIDDLDDDESAYVLEDKYQKKFVKVWNKLCELKGRAETTGRPTERKFVYSGTRFPEINRKIERFINKSKIFPDYGDIHNIVAKINLKRGLGLKGPAVDRLAREAFADVGDQLQKRRKEDLNVTFLAHLTKNTTFQAAEDPALKDPDLKKSLEENKKVSKTKIEEIINKFVEKQDEHDYNVKEGGDKSAGENEKEEEEEQDEEEEEEEEDTEDIEVPEINSIIENGEDVEDEDDQQLSVIDKTMTPTKDKEINAVINEGVEPEPVIDLDSDILSDSDSDNEEDDSVSLIDKEAKVVVTDIMKMRSPYKVGFDALLKESKQIVIETEEIDERSRSVSPELKSRIDSLVTGLMNDSSSDSESRNESSESRPRSASPELKLKITSVQHIQDEDMVIDCDNENNHIHSEKSDVIFKADVEMNTKELGKSNISQNCDSTDCLETISVDSSESNSDENASPSLTIFSISHEDTETKIHKSHNASQVNSHSDSDSDSTDASTKMPNISVRNSKTKSVSEFSISPSTSLTSSELSQNIEKDQTQENSEQQQSHTKPSVLLDRIVSVAKNKLKLNKPFSLKENFRVTKPSCGDSDSDVIEIDDSDEEKLDEVQSSQDDSIVTVQSNPDDSIDSVQNNPDDSIDNDDDDSCCIILSDSD